MIKHSTCSDKIIAQGSLVTVQCWVKEAYGFCFPPFFFLLPAQTLMTHTKDYLEVSERVVRLLLGLFILLLFFEDQHSYDIMTSVDLFSPFTFWTFDP